MAVRKKNRRIPGEWSSGYSVLHLGPTYMTVPIFYDDPTSLMADWHRIKHPGRTANTKAVIHTARLEKTPDGLPWLDIGIRRYDSQNQRLEHASERIAVPIWRGARNRPKIINHLRTAVGVTVLFAIGCRIESQLEALIAGTLAPHPGTSEVLLDGLVVFGQLYRTGVQFPIRD